MASVMVSVKKWEDEMMKAVERVEEPVLKYIGDAAESASRYVPERPEWAFLDRMPSVHELVEYQLKLTKRIVDHQAKFVRQMMKAMDPALEKIEPKATVRPRKAAGSTASKAA